MPVAGSNHVIGVFRYVELPILHLGPEIEPSDVALVSLRIKPVVAVRPCQQCNEQMRAVWCDCQRFRRELEIELPLNKTTLQVHEVHLMTPRI